MSDFLQVLPIIVGFIAGVLSGLLGIGGGIVFMPFLLFYLPLDTSSSIQIIKSSVATSLFAGSFSTTSSALNHIARKNVLVSEAVYLGAGSIIATFVFHYFVVKVDQTVISYFIFFLLLIILIENAFLKSRREFRKNISINLLFIFGLIMGFISILTGLGGGVLAIPVFTYFYKIDIKKAVGTSSVVVACTMISATFMHVLLSKSDLVSINTGLLLGLSAVIGAFIGARITSRVSSTIIRTIFSIFLSVTILKLSFDLWLS